MDLLSQMPSTSTSTLIDDRKLVNINGSSENGGTNSNGLMDSSQANPSDKRKKIVVVGLGMVAIAFMCVHLNLS